MARTFLASFLFQGGWCSENPSLWFWKVGIICIIKALLYFILLITIKRSQWLIIASSYHEIPFKHQRPDDPLRYHEARWNCLTLWFWANGEPEPVQPDLQWFCQRGASRSSRARSVCQSQNQLAHRQAGFLVNRLKFLQRKHSGVFISMHNRVRHNVTMLRERALRFRCSQPSIRVVVESAAS